MEWEICKLCQEWVDDILENVCTLYHETELEIISMIFANNDVNLPTRPHQGLSQAYQNIYISTMSLKNVQIQANNNINTQTASYYPTFSNKIK